MPHLDTETHWVYHGGVRRYRATLILCPDPVASDPLQTRQIVIEALGDTEIEARERLADLGRILHRLLGEDRRIVE